MKKDRNYNMGSYPVYPSYPGMMPVAPQGAPMMPMNPGVTPMSPGMMPNAGISNQISMPTAPNPGMMNQNMGNSDSQLTAIKSQLNSLERRVSHLEGMVNSGSNVTPKYNESNYYIV